MWRRLPRAPRWRWARRIVDRVVADGVRAYGINTGLGAPLDDVYGEDRILAPDIAAVTAIIQADASIYRIEEKSGITLR
ncbi:hypothetical protein [Duganella flavida]|uniref:hypothetical protein n=1 Tax=Duganella flavida TaxID=2692175 RepID=UPI001E657E97